MVVNEGMVRAGRGWKWNQELTGLKKIADFGQSPIRHYNARRKIKNKEKEIQLLSDSNSNHNHYQLPLKKEDKNPSPSCTEQY